MHVFLGITGASGAPYAARLLEALAAADCEIGVCASRAGIEVLATELFGNAGSRATRRSRGSSSTPTARPRRLRPRTTGSAPYASGSAKVDAYVICPCSMGTLGTIASGAMRTSSTAPRRSRSRRSADSCSCRARRRSRRSTSATCSRCARPGATILFLAPGFYHGAETVDDLVDFIVARALDQLGLDHALTPRWGQT